MKTIFFTIILCLQLSLNAGASEMDNANDVQRRIAVKLHVLNSIFGIFSGGIDVRLSQTLGLMSSFGYYKNTLGLINFNLDKTLPLESHLFGGFGLKWTFNGHALKNGFYTAGRITFDHKNSSSSGQFLVLPGAIVGFEWVHDVGLVLDFFIGLNVWGIGSIFVLPLPTMGLGIGWAV